MKTKIIPFDLETAKKIQAGEIEGKIVTRKGASVRIVSWDMKCRDNAPILALIDCGYEEEVIAVDFYGKEKVGPTESMFDLVLEVPDNEPKEPQFKPFDRVLVREDKEKWSIEFFSHYSIDGTYACSGGVTWKQCIPYASNEHLVGTTDKPKED